MFVAKVKADGTTLVCLGSLGGAGLDLAGAIAVDEAGNTSVVAIRSAEDSNVSSP